MCQKLNPQTAAQECFGISDALHNGPRCEDCDAPTSEHGVCPDCLALRRELEQDDVWPVFLASLKYGAADIDAFDDKLAGWKYVGADVQHERTSKGVAIASANNLLFLAPGHRGHLVFSRTEAGAPVITIHGGTDPNWPEWTASFSWLTPHHILLAACNAVIHTNQ